MIKRVLLLSTLAMAMVTAVGFAACEIKKEAYATEVTIVAPADEAIPAKVFAFAAANGEVSYGEQIPPVPVGAPKASKGYARRDIRPPGAKNVG